MRGKERVDRALDGAVVRGQGSLQGGNVGVGEHGDEALHGEAGGADDGRGEEGSGEEGSGEEGRK